METASPGNVEAWSAMAHTYRSRGARNAALACLRRASALAPDHPGVLADIGGVLRESGFPEQAIDLLRRENLHEVGHESIERIGPIRDEARRLHAAGERGRALDLHRQALRIAPHLAGIWLSGGILADEMGEQWTSLLFFEEAVRLNPSLQPAVECARRITVAAGIRDAARHYSQLAQAWTPSDDVHIAQALLVEAIQPSLSAMHENRRAYAAAIDELLSGSLKLENSGATMTMSAYFLAYHGENDAPLQRQAARFWSRAIADSSIVAHHCQQPKRPSGKIRVGFISRFLYSHSIGATTRGLVERLSRDAFEVCVLRITPTCTDAVSAAICRAADRAIDLDPDFRAAREQIAALELDVLFFQDIGMEPTSYLLALSRLAHVQCVSFGHPNTTGIPTMDYFVSNDLYEPDAAQSHYTERLFLLHDLPTLAYYHRPAPPRQLPERGEFGLHAQDHVYLCPQALCKVHPEFDSMLAQILCRDPRAVVVLVRGGFPRYADQLRARLAHCATLDIHRVLFLDAMPFPRFMQLLASADVCLDTLHFNGMNSSLEALSLGIPIVTLPGKMQRGRHTQAMYRKMGIHECVASDAEEYVAIAVRIGTDPEYAARLRKRILENNGVLFENPRVVEEFERFFSTSYEAAFAKRHPQPIHGAPQSS